MTQIVKFFILSLLAFNIIYAAEEEKKSEDEKECATTSKWRHPMYFGSDWWDWPLTPRKLVGQDFGLGLFDDMFTDLRSSFSRMDRLFDSFKSPYWLRPAEEGKTGLSEILNDKERFAVHLDVKHFKPEELSVKLEENSILIQGKHEEKPDEHGFISRQFSRRYMLPKEVQPESIVSKLSADGILKIEGKKHFIEDKSSRTIPIEISATGKNVEQKKEL